MTRKDYRLIARALAATRPDPVVTVFEGVENVFTDHIKRDLWSDIVGEIGDELELDDADFDRERFVKACLA